ncbi:unnamed protein product [Trichobilharzia regenti]|nr:unnamed protein product [Trichobilharzia regenti]
MRPHLKSPTSPSQYYTGRYSSRATTSPSFEYNQHNQPSENTSSSSSVITQDTLNNFNSLESDDYLTPLDRFQVSLSNINRTLIDHSEVTGAIRLYSLDLIIMGLKRPNICRKSTTREYASLSCTSYESRYILRAFLGICREKIKQM